MKGNKRNYPFDCFTFVKRFDSMMLASRIGKFLKRGKLMNTESFGKKILSIRQNANLTQEELALWMGVTPQRSLSGSEEVHIVKDTIPKPTLTNTTIMAPARICLSLQEPFFIYALMAHFMLI